MRAVWPNFGVLLPIWGPGIEGRVYLSAASQLCVAFVAKTKPMKPVHSLSDDEFAAMARRAAALPDVPPKLRQQLENLWWRKQPSLLTRILAVLTFDSAASPALGLAMRSAGAQPRHLLYAAAGRDIDLRVARLGLSFTLSGQILGPDESGRLALIAEPNDGGQADVRHAALDALGTFKFEGLAAGHYRLFLLASGQEVELPPLDIGQGQA